MADAVISKPSQAGIGLETEKREAATTTLDNIPGPRSEYASFAPPEVRSNFVPQAVPSPVESSFLEDVLSSATEILYLLRTTSLPAIAKDTGIDLPNRESPYTGVPSDQSTLLPAVSLEVQSDQWEDFSLQSTASSRTELPERASLQLVDEILAELNAVDVQLRSLSAVSEHFEFVQEAKLAMRGIQASLHDIFNPTAALSA